MEEYKPSGPYVIQTGNNAGRVLEVMMFQDFGLIRWFLNKLNASSQGGMNCFHKHLHWLVKQGENRKPTMLCPHCEERVVTRFSLMRASAYGVSGISVDTFYCCCDNDDCAEVIATHASGHFYTLFPFHFSVIGTLNTKGERKDLVNLFKKVFGLPKAIRREKAFEFFNTD